MSKHPTDYWFSPLLLLVPLPFVLASFLPVDLDHSQAAAPKAQQVAAVSSVSEPAAPAASAPRTAPVSAPQHFPR